MERKDLKHQLDQLDQQWCQLLLRRMELVAEWAAWDGNRHVGREERIALCRELVLKSLSLAPRGEAMAQLFEDWANHTAWLSEQALVERPRIAYLGPIYSFSYLAAVRHFGMTANLLPQASIAAVFEDIMRGGSDWGVVPIENSTDGRIVDTFSMFAQSPLLICGEIQLPIRHCLLAKCKRSEIRELYSKPQAISQCRKWIADHLPSVHVVEIDSTALAAEIASRKTGAAAIASREAGMHYGLDLIDDGIEDNPHNLTRFAVIGKETPSATGQDKTAILFQVPHRPGALADAMQLFRERDLNLTWIESFPIPNMPQHYLFFIEFEGHISQSRVVDALHSLEQLAVRLNVLGSYPALMLHASPTNSA